MSELADFPTLETVPMPVAAPPAAAVAKTAAIADSISAVHGEVAKFDQIAAGLARIEAAHPKNVIVADIGTAAGFKVAETGWRAYRNPRLEVERARKAAKAPVLALGKAIDAFAGELEGRLRDGEDHYKAQIDAEETRRAAEKAEAARILAERQQKQAEGVAGIRAYLSRAQTTADMTAARVANGIAMLQGMTFAAANWLDPVAAANAQCETLEGMRALHTTLVAREAEAARLEEQRRQQEAERAELERQAAAMRAEQARIARLQSMIAEIRAAATGHERATAADLYEARVAVAALDTSEAVYAEFATLASATQMATLAVLDKFHTEACDREAAEIQRVLAIPLPLTIPEKPAEAAPADGFFIVIPPESTMYAELSAPATVQPGAVLIRGEVGQVDCGIKIVESRPEPTMTLGALNEWLAPVQVSAAGLELLGFPVAGRAKAAKLYHDTDRPAIVAAMVKHLQGL